MTEHAKAHSRFGGSSASRWLNCPGSVALIETAPKARDSAYAAEGTLAHAFAEHFLKAGERDALQHVGMTLDGKVGATPLTKEMATAVQTYLDTVWEEVDAAPDAELYVEQGFVLDVPTAEPGEVFGTNDALVYTPSKGRLVVFDYKHGVGVSVSAEDNAQLKFYAAGAALHKDWRIAEVSLVIVQPRARDADEIGAVRAFALDPLELIEFSGEIEAGVRDAKDLCGDVKDFGLQMLNGYLKTGSWCRFCPAAAICPAKEAEALAAIGGDFASIGEITVDSLPPVTDLGVERLAAIAKAGSVITDYVAMVYEFMQQQMLNGVAVPGFKVVEKVGRRKWVEAEEEIADYLTLMHDVDPNLVRPRKLVTITEAERLLKQAGAGKDAKDDMSLRFTIKESSGLTVAPDHDKRPAVDAIVADFGSVNLSGN